MQLPARVCLSALCFNSFQFLLFVPVALSSLLFALTPLLLCGQHFDWAPLLWPQSARETTNSPRKLHDLLHTVCGAHLQPRATFAQVNRLCSSATTLKWALLLLSALHLVCGEKFSRAICSLTLRSLTTLLRLEKHTVSHTLPLTHSFSCTRSQKSTEKTSYFAIWLFCYFASLLSCSPSGPVLNVA